MTMYTDSLSYNLEVRKSARKEFEPLEGLFVYFKLFI